MKIIVDKNKVAIVQSITANTGEYKARNIEVELSSDFDDLTPIVNFKLPNGTICEASIVDGMVEIPPISSTGEIELGVYGYSVNGETLTKRLSPRPAIWRARGGSYKSGGSTPPVPTPGTFAELKSEIDAVREAGESGDYVTDNSVTTAKIDKNLFRDNIIVMDTDTVGMTRVKPEVGKSISIYASVKNKSITAEKIADGVIPDVSEKAQAISVTDLTGLNIAENEGKIFQWVNELSTGVGAIGAPAFSVSLGQFFTIYYDANVSAYWYMPILSRSTQSISSTSSNRELATGKAVYNAIQAALYVDSEATV